MRQNNTICCRLPYLAPQLVEVLVAVEGGFAASEEGPDYEIEENNPIDEDY